MHMKMQMVFFTAALCGLFSACTSTGTVDAAGDWELVFLEKDSEAQQIAVSTLTVSDKGGSEYELSGFSGVNRFNGKIGADGNKIRSIGGFASTRMAGPAAAMEFEQLYLDLLTSADSWKSDSDEGTVRLEIASSSRNAKARFVRRTLEGTSWNIAAMNTGSALVSKEGDITLKFVSGTRAGGSTGINIFDFGYKADPKSHALSFSDGPVTLMAGSPEESEDERLFLDGLMKTRSYSLSGKTLTLYDEAGRALLEFSRADAV